jgi:hypothetical protein
MGEKDKCKGPRGKAKTAYINYRAARLTLNHRRSESQKLCGIADEQCDLEKFEGKTGDELKAAIAECRRAGGQCSVAEERQFDAQMEYDAAESQSDKAHDEWSACEHKKKSGGKK